MVKSGFHVYLVRARVAREARIPTFAKSGFFNRIYDQSVYSRFDRRINPSKPLKKTVYIV